MAVPASRVSRVVMTGPLAGFAAAWLHTADVGESAATGGSTQQLACDPRGGGRRADPGTGRGVFGCAAGGRASPFPVVATGLAVPDGGVGRRWRDRRRTAAANCLAHR